MNITFHRSTPYFQRLPAPSPPRHFNQFDPCILCSMEMGVYMDSQRRQLCLNSLSKFHKRVGKIWKGILINLDICRLFSKLLLGAIKSGPH